MARHVALVLTGAADAEPVATSLQLAERLLARGSRVTVFAHAGAATVAAGRGEVSEAVAALLRRGVHGATLDWVVDARSADRLGVAERQAPGVVPGDHADLWSFVRDADVVLAPGLTPGPATGLPSAPATGLPPVPATGLPSAPATGLPSGPATGGEPAWPDGS